MPVAELEIATVREEYVGGERSAEAFEVDNLEGDSVTDLEERREQVLQTSIAAGDNHFATDVGVIRDGDIIVNGQSMRANLNGAELARFDPYLSELINTGTARFDSAPNLEGERDTYSLALYDQETGRITLEWFRTETQKHPDEEQTIESEYQSNEVELDLLAPPSHEESLPTQPMNAEQDASVEAIQHSSLWFEQATKTDVSEPDRGTIAETNFHVDIEPTATATQNVEQPLTTYRNIVDAPPKLQNATNSPKLEPSSSETFPPTFTRSFSLKTSKGSVENAGPAARDPNTPVTPKKESVPTPVKPETPPLPEVPVTSISPRRPDGPEPENALYLTQNLRRDHVAAEIQPPRDSFVALEEPTSAIAEGPHKISEIDLPVEAGDARWSITSTPERALIPKTTNHTLGEIRETPDTIPYGQNQTQISKTETTENVSTPERTTEYAHGISEVAYQTPERVLAVNREFVTPHHGKEILNPALELNTSGSRIEDRSTTLDNNVPAHKTSADPVIPRLEQAAELRGRSPVSYTEITTTKHERQPVEVSSVSHSESFKTAPTAVRHITDEALTAAPPVSRRPETKPSAESPAGDDLFLSTASRRETRRRAERAPRAFFHRTTPNNATTRKPQKPPHQLKSNSAITQAAP